MEVAVAVVMEVAVEVVMEVVVMEVVMEVVVMEVAVAVVMVVAVAGWAHDAVLAVDVEPVLVRGGDAPVDQSAAGAAAEGQVDLRDGTRGEVARTERGRQARGAESQGGSGWAMVDVAAAGQGTGTVGAR
jgi:hypothetical protein